MSDDVLDLAGGRRRSDLSRTGVWRSIAGYQVGVLPLPIYVVLAGSVFAAAHIGVLPADIVGGLAALMVLGTLLSDLGKRIPLLRDIGGPTIVALFGSSALVYYGVLPEPMVAAITALIKGSNFLFFYISCLVAGSILGMSRFVIIQGFLRMSIPLLLGTIASVLVGVSVGTALGLGARHTLFFIVTPILGGGIGEGVLPLSSGYAEILQQPIDGFVAQLVPAAILGNLTAVVGAGLLDRLGKRQPSLSGNGQLVMTSGHDAVIAEASRAQTSADTSLMGAGLCIACGLYVIGGLLNRYTGIPAPIAMIATTAMVKVTGVMPERMERGAFHNYRFVASALTWPIVAAVGVVFTPWQVVQSISTALVVTSMATVVAMGVAGFFVARSVRMFPIEGAIVTLCHSGLGGTGDVAILSASSRMELLPFAQVSTRIGGACVVVAVTLLMKIWH